MSDVVLFGRCVEEFISGRLCLNCLLMLVDFNPLKPKRRPLYLKTQSVPRSKHFSSGL